MNLSGQYLFSFLFRPLCLLSLCFCLLTPPVVFAAKISGEAKTAAKEIVKQLATNQAEGVKKLGCPATLQHPGDYFWKKCRMLIWAISHKKH